MSNVSVKTDITDKGVVTTIYTEVHDRIQVDRLRAAIVRAVSEELTAILSEPRTQGTQYETANP
jgi:hypothetical protein